MYTIDKLRELWKEFSKTPVDNNDNIERPFLNFPVGTDRFAIFEWFDDICPNGVVKDLVGTEDK